MNIGSVFLDGFAGLSPLAGVGDHAFRTMCKKFGAAYVVTEMASSKGLTMQGRKTEQLLTLTDEERPAGIQLFGDDPETMAEAARQTMAFHPDVIDLNMGCPAPKVAGNGGGSALMKDPALAGRITRAVVDAVPVPVTVKFRKGWDDQSVNAVEFAKIMEANGAKALAVHGRTRAQMYAPSADWAIIRQVKAAVGIPVIANGDVVDAKSAKAILETTGADFLFVGRAACGAPWIFAQINHYLSTGELLPDPDLPTRLAIMKEHIALLCADKGESLGMKEARKHCGWYLKGLHGAAVYRKATTTLTTYAELLQMTQDILAYQKNHTQNNERP